MPINVCVFVCFLKHESNYNVDGFMIPVKKIMKTHVITITPEANISDAAKIMTNNRVGSLIIVRNKKPVGILTDDDIVGVVARGKDPKKVQIKSLPAKKKFITASPEERITDVTKKMIKNGVKRIPVIKNGKLLGNLKKGVLQP